MVAGFDGGSGAIGGVVAEAAHTAGKQGFTAALHGAATGPYRAADGGLFVASKAALNKGGRVFPLICARCRMPCLALSLKKYFGGAEASSTCDNEHAAAPLGYSEILGIEDAPGDFAGGAKHSTRVRPFFPCRLKR